MSTERLRLRTEDPFGTDMGQQDRTDLSGVPTECEGVDTPTERLRLRSSVASLGARGTVNCDGVRLTDRLELTETERECFSGVPAGGVRAPTE